MPKFSPRSESRLNSCHEDLQRLFYEVIKEFDCSILCGYRDSRAQHEAYIKGYSRVDYPDSKHNKFPSRAVDVAPYPIDWNDLEAFNKLAQVVKQKAQELGIEVKWGAEFKTFEDYPHWELK